MASAEAQYTPCWATRQTIAHEPDPKVTCLASLIVAKPPAGKLDGKRHWVITIE